MSRSRLRIFLTLISGLAVVATSRAIIAGEWRTATGLYLAAVAGLVLLLLGQSRTRGRPAVAGKPAPDQAKPGISMPQVQALPVSLSDGGRDRD